MIQQRIKFVELLVHLLAVRIRTVYLGQLVTDLVQFQITHLEIEDRGLEPPPLSFSVNGI